VLQLELELHDLEAEAAWAQGFRRQLQEALE
jgi:hypothetical protein